MSNNMKILVIMLAFALIEIEAQLEGTKEDQECQAENKGAKGLPIDDPRYAEWLGCVYRKMGLISATGTVNPEVYARYVRNSVSEDLAESLLDVGCQYSVKGDTDVQTASLLAKCMANHMEKYPSSA